MQEVYIYTIESRCIYEQTSESLELSRGVCVELGLT